MEDRQAKGWQGGCSIHYRRPSTTAVKVVVLVVVVVAASSSSSGLELVVVGS